MDYKMAVAFGVFQVKHARVQVTTLWTPDVGNSFTLLSCRWVVLFLRELGFFKVDTGTVLLVPLAPTIQSKKSEGLLWELIRWPRPGHRKAELWVCVIQRTYFRRVVDWRTPWCFPSVVLVHFLSAPPKEKLPMFRPNSRVLLLFFCWIYDKIILIFVANVFLMRGLEPCCC